MSERIWYSIDFGSAFIRVARARVVAEPEAVAPAVIEFHDRSALLNLAIVAPEGDALEEVGADVLAQDSTLTHPHLYSGASLADDPQSEGGRVAWLLLAYAFAALRRDHGLLPDDPAATAIVALPMAARSNDQAKGALEARLRAVGFTNALAAESAPAVLTHYAGGRPAQGRYVVVDAGYVWTRFALVECGPEGQPRVIDAGRAMPGGRDFDAALLNYFAARFGWAGENASHYRSHIVDYKHRFAAAWADGESSLVSRELIGGQLQDLSLNTSAFVSPDLAGPLIDEFCRAADAFVDQHLADGELSGIALAGGGAHWPFVQEWAARRLGPAGNVLTDEFPEEAVVRGLPRLAALAQSAPPPSPNGRGPGPDGHGRKPPKAPPVDKALLSPAVAGVIEFLLGIVGFLGLGWFLGAKKVVTGFVLLFGWWLTLVLLFAFGVMSALSDQPAVALVLLPVWIGVPLASGTFVYRAGRRLEGRE